MLDSTSMLPYAAVVSSLISAIPLLDAEQALLVLVGSAPATCTTS